jgi:hypothetical protein
MAGAAADAGEAGRGGAAAGAPEDAAVLSGASHLWLETRRTLETSLDQLRGIVGRHYSQFRPEKFDQITRGLDRLDGVLDRLDHRLAESLTRACSTDEAARRAELRNAQALIAEYTTYAESDPLIALVDRNPFGVETNVRQTILEALSQLTSAVLPQTGSTARS